MSSQSYFFRLRPGGLDCNPQGLTLAGKALLKRAAWPSGREFWEPASISEIQSAFQEVYGSAFRASDKVNGLRFIAAALNAGDIARAQIASVFLRLPDPADVTAQSDRLGGVCVDKDWKS